MDGLKDNYDAYVLSSFFAQHEIADTKFLRIEQAQTESAVKGAEVSQ
jgi:hypothetical protein